ncbi:sporulation integral membrane protein YtvI [Litchfieldia alkalitelluris]|uniref:sporulation integral membrane protein YtvI n=1 Tax=Litchfieldia alkalitelluris TaxID=304268 RepID=UPI00099681B0|nr:sporulation integral membrane protein YtvI [Litchfieldia alkalitelluris]
MWKRWSIILLCVLLVLFLIPYSLPFVFAFVTAIFLDGIIQWLAKSIRITRFQSVIVVFISYVFLLMLITYHFISIIAKQTVNLLETTPIFIEEFYINTLIPLIQDWEAYSENLPSDVLLLIQNKINDGINAIKLFSNEMIQNIFNLMTAIPGFLIEFLIYLIAVFLICLTLPQLKANIEKHLSTKTKEKVLLITKQLNHAGVGFIKAQIILSLLTFAMAFLGLLILKVPYLVILSLLIVIVDILPILGTGSVLVPWAIVAILQENHFLGIGLITLFLVITVVRRVIEPKIYSSSLGISPLASLISLYIGFQLIGILGVFLGPIVVIIFDTLKKANIIKLNFKI